MVRTTSALILLLAACAATSSGSMSAYQAGPPAGEGLGVELSSLVRGVSEESGCRIVSLELCNETDRAIQFSWGVEWMDQAGETCPGTPAEWQRARLDAGASSPVEIKAPTPKAASWRIIAVEKAP